MNYFCKVCNYDTNIKANFNRHLTLKSHKTRELFINKIVNNNDDINKLDCKNCGKLFKFKSSLSQHKNSCLNDKSDDDANIKTRGTQNIPNIPDFGANTSAKVKDYICHGQSDRII